jgi:hypothetical protein
MAFQIEVKPNLGTPEANVLVAHVTVNNETLIVKTEDIQIALFALAGLPAPGLRIQADIRIDLMHASEFDEIPEHQ